MEKTLTTWNIASATRPKDFPAFKQCLVGAATEHGKIELVGMLVVPGPGCMNYGLLISGDEKHAEIFAKQVCLVLQPGKFCQCDNGQIEVGQFTFSED